MELLSTLLPLAHRLFTLFLALAGIGFLIGFHELGHFAFCKLFGVKTPTFSIGFGPTLWSRKIGGTLFTLAAIPLGGFVEIAGAAEVGQGEQEDAESTAHDSFATKPYYQKFCIMMGGILFNLLFAYAAFIGISLTSTPKTQLLYPFNATTTIEQIKTDSAAEQSGIAVGDTIIALNNEPISNAKSIIETVQASPGKKTTLTVLRDTKEKELDITIGQLPDLPTIGTLGLVFSMSTAADRSFLDSIKQGVAITNHWISKTVEGFGKLVRGSGLENMGGPLAIIVMNTQAASQGMAIYLLFLAVISINLAILNLIPLPILDGGQLLFYTIEAIIQRPLSIQVRNIIHIATWVLMLFLITLLSIRDISRIAAPFIESARQYLGF